jgi:hypothetical protein
MLKLHGTRNRHSLLLARPVPNQPRICIHFMLSIMLSLSAIPFSRCSACFENLQTFTDLSQGLHGASPLLVRPVPNPPLIAQGGRLGGCLRLYIILLQEKGAKQVDNVCSPCVQCQKCQPRPPGMPGVRIQFQSAVDFGKHVRDTV